MARRVVERIAEFRCGLIRALAYAPASPCWAASDGRILHLYCEDTPAMSAPVPGRPGSALRFDTSGTRVLIAPHVFDVAMHAWEPSDAAPASWPAPGGYYEMGAAAWSPDGDELVAAWRHRPARSPRASDAGDVPSERLVATHHGAPRGTVLWEGDRMDAIRAIAVGRQHIVAGGAVVGIWERGSLRQVAEVEAHRLAARDLAFGHGDALLASVGADGRLVVWNAADWTELAARQVSASELQAVAFHPQEPVLASGGADGVLRLHGLDAAPLHEEPLGAAITALAFAPAGDRLLAALGGSDPHVIGLRLR